MPPKLIIEVVGDTSNYSSALKRADKNTQQFGRSVERSSKGVAKAGVSLRNLVASTGLVTSGFVGAAGLITVLSKSVAAASSLNEQTSKTNVVFGESAKEIRRWSTTAASSMGLAQDQALATASSFGALFRPLGIVGDEAVNQSKRLTQLGADLASFYDTDVQSALDALRSGLVGEAEPLRRYGALLSETRVQNVALNQTGKATAAQLTQQDKVLARLALIYKDTKVAQGDFARTSGGLANQQRTLSANIRDTEIAIGKALTPTVTELTTELNKWLGNTENQQKLNEALTGTVAALTAVVQGATPVIGAYASAFGQLAGAVGAADSAIRGLHLPGLGAVGKGALQGIFPGLALPGLFGGGGGRRTGDLVGNANVQKPVPPTSKFFFTPTPPGSNIPRAKPTGLDALTRAQKNALARALAERTASTSDDLKALTDQREILAGKIRDTQRRLEQSSGKTATLLADKLQGFYDDDAAAFSRITSITEGAARDAQALRDKAAAAAKKITDARAAAAKKLADAQAASRAASLQDLLRSRTGGAGGLKGLTLGNLREQFTAANRAANAREQAAQFRALGLTGTGDAFLPTRGAFREQLAKVSDQLKGTLLDTDANRNQLSKIRDALNKNWDALTGDTKRKIKELLDALDSMNDGDKIQSRFKHISPNKLAEQLGFGGRRDATRRAAAILSQIGVGGTVPSGNAAFAGAHGGGIHFHGTTNINVRGDDTGKVEADLAKRARARPQVRRGAR